MGLGLWPNERDAEPTQVKWARTGLPQRDVPPTAPSPPEYIKSYTSAVPGPAGYGLTNARALQAGRHDGNRAAAVLRGDEHAATVLPAMLPGRSVLVTHATQPAPLCGARNATSAVPFTGWYVQYRLSPSTCCCLAELAVRSDMAERQGTMLGGFTWICLELWIEPSRQLAGQAAISAPGDQNRTPRSAAWPRQLYQASNQTGTRSRSQSRSWAGAALGVCPCMLRHTQDFEENTNRYS